MRHKTGYAVLALLAAWGGPGGAAAQTQITSFDPPNSILTEALEINSGGAIVGYYQESDYRYHGFMRSADGTITTFDPTGSNGTYAMSLDSNGDVAGRYEDQSSTIHGFVRSSSGTIVSFDPQNSHATFANGINDNGVIVGNFLGSDDMSHGFVRQANGTITTFDPAGSNGTYVYSINDNDYITGSYLDGNGAIHGFVRHPNGTITTYDPEGDTYGVGASMIDSGDTIAGTWFDSDNDPRVFAVGPTGVVSEPRVAALCPYRERHHKIGYAPCPAYGNAMNPSGTITGSYIDESHVYHGYEFSGGFTSTFDPSGSTDTYAMSINASADIAGYYADQNAVLHGFVLTP